MIFLWLVCGGLLLALSTSHFVATGWFSHAHSRSAYRGRMASQWQRRNQAQLARLEAQMNLCEKDQLLWKVLQVVEVDRESQDCCSFYLSDPNGQALASFLPGQYIMVRPALAGRFQATRCYSISSAPDPSFWRITVKRQDCSPTDPGSTAQRGLSGWLHDTIRPGDFLLASRPLGEFVLDENSQRARVMIAAGIGVTPLASMLRRSLETAEHIPLHLYFQARNPRCWPLGKTLHSWQAGHGHFHVTSCFSQTDEDELCQLRNRVTGRILGGYLSGSQICQEVRSVPGAEVNQQPDFYLCGPDAWMRKIRGELHNCGVDAGRLHWESFCAAAPMELPQPELFRPCSVRFDRSQLAVQWDDPQQTIWELARQSGVNIPGGCLTGVCGTCRTKVLSGEVEYVRAPRSPAKQGECFACVARPSSELVLDV